MVRAATTGAFNYAHADPSNRQWRLRHILTMRELVRQQDEKILLAAHEHWLAYVTHSNLEPESWNKIKKQAADTLEQINYTIFPWTRSNESKAPEDTIDNKYGSLIAQYRQLINSKASDSAPPETNENAEN
jgi:hypothetical protein